MAKLYLKKSEEHRLKSGHLWVFSNEVAKLEGAPENGDIVEVLDSKNISLGFGFYNKSSLIAVRLLKKYEGDFHRFAEEHIQKAFDLRKSFYPGRDSFRLVFSESDFLPGLIIDKYNDTYVLQIYSCGMQKNIEHVIRILRETFSARNIFSLNDPYFRKLEDLPEENETYLGQVEQEIINDGRIEYKVDFTPSQKTGFYFDQCDNREFIERFVKHKNVLDAFCYSGGFGLHAGLAGAASVTFVDSSDREIQKARENFSLNNLSSNAEFISQDVFDFLQKRNAEGRFFDAIILDPPAFAKSKRSIPTAVKGYTKLSRLAMQCLPPGGILVTSSCSHHITQDDFLKVVNNAAAKSNRTIQLLHVAGASLDHPRLPSMDETSYLKFAVFKVL